MRESINIVDSLPDNKWLWMLLSDRCWLAIMGNLEAEEALRESVTWTTSTGDAMRTIYRLHGAEHPLLMQEAITRQQFPGGRAEKDLPLPPALIWGSYIWLGEK